jgi:three-Cys-motif partner protein
MGTIKLDEVGLWTEIKLQILRDYSAAYSAILSKQAAIRHYAYIDGFAGAGNHISKTTGEEVIGGMPTSGSTTEVANKTCRISCSMPVRRLA